jgi:hypothetical protein
MGILGTERDQGWDGGEEGGREERRKRREIEGRESGVNLAPQCLGQVYAYVYSIACLPISHSCSNEPPLMAVILWSGFSRLGGCKKVLSCP